MLTIMSVEDARTAIQNECAEFENGVWWVAREDCHTPASSRETRLLAAAREQGGEEE